VITREELLKIAARVVGEVGFDRASVRRIAAEAGVSYGTVQHHFKTKQALWKALVDEVLVPSFTRRKDVSPEPGAALSEQVRARIENAVVRPGLSGAILMDASPGAFERLSYLAEALTEPQRQELMIIKALQQAGLIRDVSVDALQVTVGIALSSLASAGPAIRALVGPDLGDADEREQLAAGIADLLLYGLLPR